MESRAYVPILVLFASFCFILGSASAQLSVDYYSKTCPNAEEVVRKEMIQILSVAPSLAGPFLRLHFHDCFVRVLNHFVIFTYIFFSVLFLFFFNYLDSHISTKASGTGKNEDTKSTIIVSCNIGL
jgi:hypothetical protein